MGLLQKLGIGRKGNVWERWVELMDFGNRSKAGPTVNKENIWRVSAALACMGVRARGVAQVPFKLFQETQKGGLRSIQPARQHPLYDKLAARPNAWQTSFEFREQLELHLCLGNAFVFKNFYRNQVEEMFLLCNVRAEQQEDRTCRYWVRGSSGEEREIPAANIWHLRGLSWDGFLGLDTLNIAKEALGLSMALENTAASLHANGVRPSGVYSVEGNLSTEQHDKLVAWLKKEAAAPGSTMVLDRNAKWLSTAMTSVDAQHGDAKPADRGGLPLLQRAADHDRLLRRQGEHLRERGGDVHGAQGAHDGTRYADPGICRREPADGRGARRRLLLQVRGERAELGQPEGPGRVFRKGPRLRRIARLAHAGRGPRAARIRPDGRRSVQATAADQQIPCARTGTRPLKGKTMELRYIERPFEVKAVQEDGVFEGYGSIFGNVDSYKEIVAPGAFAESLNQWKEAGRLPPVLWQHRSGEPIGPFVQMSEDGVGLRVKGQLLVNDVQRAKEARALMKAKAVNGLSIGFVTREDSYDKVTGIRTLKKVDLWEVSVVTFPANPAAQISSVKSAIDGIQPCAMRRPSYGRSAAFATRRPRPSSPLQVPVGSEGV
jgi:HK97 family phage prohead protease